MLLAAEAPPVLGWESSPARLSSAGRSLDGAARFRGLKVARKGCQTRLDELGRVVSVGAGDKSRLRPVNLKGSFAAEGVSGGTDVSQMLGSLEHVLPSQTGTYLLSPRRALG